MLNLSNEINILVTKITGVELGKTNNKGFSIGFVDDDLVAKPKNNTLIEFFGNYVYGVITKSLGNHKFVYSLRQPCINSDHEVYKSSSLEDLLSYIYNSYEEVVVSCYLPKLKIPNWYLKGIVYEKEYYKCPNKITKNPLLNHSLHILSKLKGKIPYFCGFYDIADSGCILLVGNTISICMRDGDIINVKTFNSPYTIPKEFYLSLDYNSINEDFIYYIVYYA